MDYISSMVVKTKVASITEGKHIIHGKLKKNALINSFCSSEQDPIWFNLICVSKEC